MVEVSVVMPTFNRIGRLKRVLSALEQQTYPRDRFEVIIVSDGSSDGTLEFLESLVTPMQLKYCNQPNGGPAAARNRGIQMASGEIVLFLDDDVVPVSQMIAEHVNWHHRYGCEAVIIGPMLSPDDFRYSPWVHWEQSKLARYYQAMMSGHYSPSPHLFYTGNASLDRRHLIECGGFNTKFRRAEDIELAYRLEKIGLEFYFNPQAIGYHYAERSFESWVKIPYQYGMNDVILARQNSRPDLRTDIYKDFNSRNKLIQLLLRIYLDRPAASRSIIALIKAVSITAYRLGLTSVAMAACSAAFNLGYFQGVCDQVHGKQAFLAELADWKRKADYAGTL